MGRIVETLMKEIEALDNISFEKMCYRLCDVLTGKKLIHRGLNPDGQPSGYTVDSYSDDGSIVAEYSVAKNYFSDLRKPEGDFKHAQKLFPTVKTVYLMAGVTARKVEGSRMANRCRELQVQSGCVIFWYDARRIAETIVQDLLTRTELIDKLSEYLPSIREIYASHPNTVKLPGLPKNYRISTSMRDEPYHILTNKNALYIFGLSGIGKTCLSTKLANIFQESETLDAIYFIDGSQIEDAYHLSMVDYEMAGQRIDLLETIKTRRTLVIIDDLRRDIDHILECLLDTANGSSYVIVTSQESSGVAHIRGIDYQIPFLTEDRLVEGLLNWNLPKEKRCPTETIQLIQRKTGGYPLLLESLRSAVYYNRLNWTDIEELLEDIAAYEVSGGKTLMSRLLQRHLEVLSRELFAIQWIESQYISEPLLAKLITKDGINKLSKRSLIQKTASIIKIHDIIYQCILELAFERENEKNQQRCKEKFYKYFMLERDRKSSEYYRALHLHENKLKSLAEQSATPGVEWYFYLQAFSGDDIDMLTVLFPDSSSLKEQLDTCQDEYVVGTALEYVENRLRWMDRNSPSYQEYLQKQIETFQKVLTKVKLGSKVYTDIIHHLGKLYRKLGEMNRALECFLCVLKFNPAAYETKLQVARIYKNDSSYGISAIDEYCKLLDVYISGNPISMSVVLATYQDLYSADKMETKRSRYFIDNFSYFRDAVSSMAVESFDQPYAVLAGAIKFYTYDYPELVFELTKHIPIPSIEDIKQGTRFDVAQICKERGKALMWSEDPTLETMAPAHFEAAERFYKAVISTRMKSCYQRVQRAENLILLKQFSLAMEFLMEIPFPTNPFWNQRVGQALTYSDPGSALQYLQRAIDLGNENETYSKFMAAFYHSKAMVLASLRDPDAKQYFETALKLCRTKKFMLQVERDMNSLYELASKP